MSKLDDILEFAPEHNTKQQIKDLMLELIKEEEDDKMYIFDAADSLRRRVEEL